MDKCWACQKTIGRVRYWHSVEAQTEGPTRVLVMAVLLCLDCSSESRLALEKKHEDALVSMSES